MQVTLDKVYPIKAPIGACWAVLSDIPALATCMPGAAITEVTDDKNYKGQVKVKVGPAVAAFAGTIEVLAVDVAGNSLTMLGKGADKGGSSASMQLTATLRAEADGSTSLLGNAEVIVNGKFAQFGGRMMNSVADMILGQFAGNFEGKAMALAPAAGGAESASAAPAAAPAVATELNGLAIFWALVKSLFQGLFGRKA
jgi:carbon monoxide dehydrogenase subunit G